MTAPATQTFDLSGSDLDTVRRIAAHLGLTETAALLYALGDYQATWAEGSRPMADITLHLGGFVGEFQPGPDDDPSGDWLHVHLMCEPITVILAPSKGLTPAENVQHLDKLIALLAHWRVQLVEDLAVPTTRPDRQPSPTVGTV